MLVYKNLSIYLDENLAGFKHERTEIKKLISTLIWATQAHWTEDGAVVISTSFLRDDLRSSQAAFNRVNSDYGFFDAGEYTKGSSRPLYPRPIVTELLVGFVLSSQSTTLTILDGKTPRPRSAKSKDFKVNIDDVVVPTGVKVDVDAINSFIKNLPYMKFKVEGEREILKQEALKFFSLTVNNIFDYGVVPQMYKRSRNGRIYGTGASIQRTRKSLRTALMNGSWDYDFENCHISILGQQNIKTPTIDYYNDNKKKVRYELTEYLGFDPEIKEDVDLIKQCILAVTFGAVDNYHKKNSIVRYLGKDKAKLFWKHDFINSFKEEIVKAGEVLLGFKKSSSKDFSKDLANKLQNIESQMLNICCRSANPSVLMFDGFISRDDLDTNKLEKLIELELNYKMKVSKKRIIYGN